MKVTTKSDTYKIAADTSTGKNSIVGVDVFVDYEVGDTADATDWVCAVRAGTFPATYEECKDKSGRYSEWRNTFGRDFRGALAVPCLDLKTMQPVEDSYEMVVFARGTMSEIARSKPFRIVKS